MIVGGFACFGRILAFLGIHQPFLGLDDELNDCNYIEILARDLNAK